MVVSEDRFRGEGRSHESHYPGNGFSAELEAVRWEKEMLVQTKAGEWEELTLQEVEENGRNMCWLSMFVHGPDFSREEKLKPSRQRVHIWSGNDRNAFGT